jgi:beta-glucanase (GH16 family)
MAHVATGALTRTVRRRGFLQLCLVLLLAGGLVTACGGAPAEQPHRKLVWSDEFGGAAGAPPDPAHWVHDTGGHGWGNHELQCYTDSPENASTDGAGHLVIRAVRTDAGCADGAATTYTSARITTSTKYATTHGRIEVRAKLPDGRGTWPAFWMLGDDFPDVGWPRSGEIDVMEHVGNKPGEISGTLHGLTDDGGHWYLTRNTQVPAVTSDFHTFAADWQEDSVTLSVDGKDYGRVDRDEVEEKGTWPFDKPFFLLLNLAVGGDLGGEVPPSTTWPQEYVVDWVRVYH